MRSVRLEHDLERKLCEAAASCGEPISQFIRDAVREKCERVLGDRLDARLADVVGAFSSGRRRTDARRTGRAFAALLKRNRRRKRG